MVHCRRLCCLAIPHTLSAQVIVTLKYHYPLTFPLGLFVVTHSLTYPHPSITPHHPIHCPELLTIFMDPVHQQLLILTSRPAPVCAVETVDLSIGIFIYRVIMPALLYRTNIHNSAHLLYLSIRKDAPLGTSPLVISSRAQPYVKYTLPCQFMSTVLCLIVC